MKLVQVWEIEGRVEGGTPDGRHLPGVILRM